MIVANGCGQCNGIIPASCSGIKVNSTGQIIAQENYDTSKSKNQNKRKAGLDIYKFDRLTSEASLAWNTNDNTLGLVMSRTMSKDEHGVTYSFTHSLTHPHTHSLTHTLTHSPTHPPTNTNDNTLGLVISRTMTKDEHGVTHSLTHSHTHSITHSLTHSPTH